MATYTAVQSRSTMKLTHLKKHLNIDPAYTELDDLLTQKLKAAKEKADNFLQNAFEDMSIPMTVEEWVLAQAAQSYEWSILGQNTNSVPGAGSSKLSKGQVEDYLPIRPWRDPKGKIGF